MKPASRHDPSARPAPGPRRAAGLRIARPDSVIDRPGLVRTLVAARAARVVLIAAPAGYGKTTLVSRWEADPAETRPFARVALDETCDGPVALWTAILLALDSATGGAAGDDLGRLLRARGADEQVRDLLVPHLLGRLGALRTPLVLVLDGYHAVTDPDCHRRLASLIARLPEAVQLVLVTRAGPALPLARYRAAGETLELRADRLRFTRAEAGRLVRLVAGLDLAGRDLDALAERTEGWPAAVSLAALALREHPDTAIARDLTGTDRHIADYLAEEVLEPLPAALRAFLVRTSILAEFTAPLCGAVTGTDDAEAALGRFDRDDLFLVPLDGARRRYRYHRLFAEALRGELARTEPGLVPELHRRASDWYERAGMAGEAIGHALAAGDLDRAVAVAARGWFGLVAAGRAAALRGWLAAIGSDRVHSDPVAAVCAAWAAAACGDRPGLRYWLREIEGMPGGGRLPDGAASPRAAVALIRATYGYDGVRRTVEAAGTAAGLERDPTSPWYALARLALGFARYLAGDAAAAVEPLEEAVRAEGARDVMRPAGLALLAMAAAERGRAGEAAELARAAGAALAEQGTDQGPAAGLIHTAHGVALAALGRGAEAVRDLERGLRLFRELPGIPPAHVALNLIATAELAAGRGEPDRAGALLDDAAALLGGVPGDGGLLESRHAALRRHLATAARRSAGGAGSPPAEPLTERERAVLRLLRGPLSYREIGARLFVSVNTVKTHARSIYRKLGASSREEAVRKARDLGLL
ncbi:LuxR C-terminal-related transcriptional regulator [Spirillospora sp. NPDC029432]|uniref:LuxR C-terminal-related transcriptional regulator n=1 Tax=Spirillospora sp. NPDC029432 TaxID=3154599 RepID=UPI003454F38D